MKQIMIAAVAFSILSSAAHAETINLRTYKCSEFVSLTEETKDLVSVWLDGYLADDEAADGLTVDFSGTDADELSEYCAANSESTVLQAAEGPETEQ